jgi:hypothetical protein
MTAGASALARYARAQKLGEQLDAAADLVDARVAFDVARAEVERALAEARSYGARYRSARDAGWTTEELRTQLGCRPPVFDEVRPALAAARGEGRAAWGRDLRNN